MILLYTLNVLKLHVLDFKHLTNITIKLSKNCISILKKQGWLRREFKTLITHFIQFLTTYHMYKNHYKVILLFNVFQTRSNNLFQHAVDSFMFI